MRAKAARLVVLIVVAARRSKLSMPRAATATRHRRRRSATRSFATAFCSVDFSSAPRRWTTIAASQRLLGVDRFIAIFSGSHHAAAAANAHSRARSTRPRRNVDGKELATAGAQPSVRTFRRLLSDLIVLFYVCNIRERAPRPSCGRVLQRHSLYAATLPDILLICEEPTAGGQRRV